MEEQRKKTKVTMPKIGILLLVEAIILIVLAVSCVKMEPEVIPSSLYDWSSNYIQISDDGTWYIDQSSSGLTESALMMYGPYIELEKGVYEIAIDYESDYTNYCIVSSVNHSPYIRSDTAFLEKNRTSERFFVELTEDVDDLEIKIDYRAQGYLKINDITITTSRAAHTRNLVIAILVFLLLDVFLWFFEPWKKNRNLYLCLGGIVFLSMLPAMVGGINSGHDFVFHMVRLEGVVEGLKNGEFPVRIQSNWMAGYGYPVSVYYGDVLLYIPALFRICGFSLTSAYKIYLFIINLGTTVFSYICFKQIFKNKKIAVVTTGAYVLAAYRLVDLYVRSAVGEYSALMFLPIIALGMYGIYTEGIDDWRKARNYGLSLAAGMTGLLLTHILTLEMVAVVLILVVLVLIKKTIKPKVIGAISLGAVVTVVVNAFFLVPFFDYYNNLSVLITENIADETAMKIQHYGAYIGQYFSFFTKINGYADKYAEGRLMVTPGLLLMAALVIFIVLFVQGKRRKDCCFYAGFSFAMLFMASDLFPWDALAAHVPFGEILAQVQFPWRYVGIAVIFLTLLLGSMLKWAMEEEIKDLPKLFTTAAAVVVLMTCYLVGNIYDESYTVRHYDSAALDEFALMGREYLLTNTNLNAMSGKLYASGCEEAVINERKGLDMELYCRGGAGQGTVVIPILNYPGYQVYDEDGTEFERFVGSNNEIGFYLPAEYDGIVSVEFVEPRNWRLAEQVTYWSLVSLVIYLISDKRRKTRVLKENA